VRAFLLAAEEAARARKAIAYRSYDGNRIVGECYEGREPAVGIVRASEVMPMMEARFTGKALQCFVTTYFGCRVGEWLGRVGDGAQGPAYVVQRSSPVAILEQTPDRIVAAVMEVDRDAVGEHGEVSRQRIGLFADIYGMARYVLERDDEGVWRIADRQPPPLDDWWKCE
jgi:hypothetical protein